MWVFLCFIDLMACYQWYAYREISLQDTVSWKVAVPSLRLNDQKHHMDISLKGSRFTHEVLCFSGAKIMPEMMPPHHLHPSCDHYMHCICHGRSWYLKGIFTYHQRGREKLALIQGTPEFMV